MHNRDAANRRCGDRAFECLTKLSHWQSWRRSCCIHPTDDLSAHRTFGRTRLKVQDTSAGPLIDAFVHEPLEQAVDGTAFSPLLARQYGCRFASVGAELGIGIFVGNRRQNGRFAGSCQTMQHKVLVIVSDEATDGLSRPLLF